MCIDKNSVILITGGSTGIGEALVHIFLQRECYVIIVDKKEGNSPQTVYHYGQNRCQFYKCNIEDEVDVSELFIKIMEKHVRIDYLINAAGIKKYNEDPEAYPSAKMTKYACIMMTRQKVIKKNSPYLGVIVDLADGSKQGVDEISRSGLCPIYFQQGIRIVHTPLNIFLGAIPQQQLKDISYSIFKLALSDIKHTQFLQLSPIGSPSL